MKFSELKKDQLPAEWQKLDDAELKVEIEKKQEERTELQAKILKLNQSRDDYLAVERKKRVSVKADSFDEQVAAAIRAQAARKGITYAGK